MQWLLRALLICCQWHSLFVPWAGLDGGIQYDVFNMNMKPDMIHCLAHTPLYYTVMSPYNRCLDCFRLMASGIGGLSD